MKKKVLITSALPYANGPLHFGHIAGAYLPADAHARFERLRGEEVLFICGSDEYGVAITMSADMAKRTPREHVDIFHAINKDFFKTLNLSFDHYSRTTWEGHKEPVQEFFLDLLNNGYIEEKVTDQLYSEKEGRFLADRYVVGTCPKCGDKNARGDECTHCGTTFDATDLIEPRSKLTGSPLVHRSTKHWFLLLDKFQKRLSDWLETKDWKPNVLNFIKGYIQDLHPRAITRDSDWGIPVPLPGSEGKVLYVWFDAPIGYISATQEGFPDRWKDFWLDPETKLINFIGKDNIPFHAAIFPAMVMGQNTPYKLVDELPANEFYKLEGRQFSKSEGWTIDLETFFKSYTADQIRYAIAANAPETSDSEFTWQGFQLRCNTDLLGKYGNLVNRVLVFAQNQVAGIAPHRHASLEPIDFDTIEKAKIIIADIEEAYRTFRLRKAVGHIMDLAALGNVYFDAKKPWTDAKDHSKKGRMETTIAVCLGLIKSLAITSAPIIPETAEKVWKMLGFKDPMSWNEAKEMTFPPGQLLENPVVLFRRLEDTEIEAEIKKLHQMAKEAKALDKTINENKTMTPAPLKPIIEYPDFQKIDLRVGEILAAEPVPKSKKLLKLQVDLGFEKRQIVSGIALHYTPEQIIGKRVAVVANLKTATLMGIESQGMILAGEEGEALKLIDCMNLPLGSQIA